MDRGNTCVRVVVVSSDGLLTPQEQARLSAAGVACEQVTSPYEAAAALLAAPATAVAVDLPVLNRGHLRMLEMARKLGVSVLATGAIPAGLTGEDLRGVRLLSRTELTDALLSAAPAQQARTDTEPNEGHYEPQPRPETYENSAGKVAVRTDEVAEPEGADTGEKARDDSYKPEDTADHTPARRKTGSDILSADEIAALLEQDL